MEFSYDRIADALYIYLSKSPVAETEQLNDHVMVDYDVQNRICGIEIIDFSKIGLDLNTLIRMNNDELIANVTSV